MLSIALSLISTHCRRLHLNGIELDEDCRHTTIMNHAFSLFELLVVMAMIAILALVSYPVYTHHIAKVNCQQTRVALLIMANSLEQAYSRTNNYSKLNITQLTSHYTHLPYMFRLHASKQHYQLTAVAKHPQGLTTPCQRLTINHADSSALIPE